jgi:hypothetical protein
MGVREIQKKTLKKSVKHISQFSTLKIRGEVTVFNELFLKIF